MAMLNAFHNQNHDQFVYTCNSCKSNVATRYHCSQCEDFDLCAICYNKEGHKHHMDKFGFDENSSNSDQKQINPQDYRKLSIQRCVQSLVHSSHCGVSNCRMPSCLNMKKIIAHAKQCEIKANRRCVVCQRFVALCYHHAKPCQATKCPVLFCLIIRHKLRQQQLQHRMKQAQVLKGRIATMQNREMPSAVTQNTAENSYAASQPSPVVQVPAPPYPTQQPGMDIKQLQVAQGMNPMQAVQQGQTMRLAVPQHVASGNLSYGKSNPMVQPSAPIATLMSQHQMQAQMQQKRLPEVLGVRNRVVGLSDVNRWENTNYTPNSQPHPNLQPQPSQQMGLRQQSQLIGSGGMPSSNGNPAVRGPSQIVPQQGPSLPNQQIYLQTLKCQITHQLLSIIKSNPQLMAAFIKLRTAQKMQQQ